MLSQRFHDKKPGPAGYRFAVLELESSLYNLICVYGGKGWISHLERYTAQNKFIFALYMVHLFSNLLHGLNYRGIGALQASVIKMSY